VVPADPPAPNGDPAARPAADGAGAGPPADVELVWHRPHPLTIIIEIGNALRSLIVALVVVQGGFLDAGGLIELAVIASPLAAAIGRWYTTRYAVGPESVFHQYGLIRRHKQVLPRANVQNVATRAGLVARLGSVVELQISDASSDGDINLRLISRPEADRLTTLLRPATAPTTHPPVAGTSEPVAGTSEPAVGTGEPGATPTAGPAPTPSPPTTPAPVGGPIETPPLAAPTFGAVVRAEITSVSALMVTATIVALTVTLVRLAGSVDELAPAGEWATLVWVVGLTPLLVALPGLGSKLMALGGFRLDAEPDRLRITTGLLTEARIALRRERLQRLQVERDLTHQLLGIERIRYVTADVELGATTSATGYLSPVEPLGHWRVLATDALGEIQLDERDLRPVSPLTVRRSRVRFALAAPLVVAPVAIVHLAFGTLVALGWGAVAWWYSNRRFAVLGWALSEDQYLVRVGVIQQRLTMVRLDKIQSLRLTATPPQRWLGLATVSVSTAGLGSQLVSVPDLPTDQAQELLDSLASRSAHTPLADTL
jgi:uncharacterized membrane protein YdbT with pleckstrin-like domain